MNWYATLLLLLCGLVASAIAADAPIIVLRGLERADLDRASLVVLELDTPGGLDTSMRSIIKGILASRVPVASYVSPQGARGKGRTRIRHPAPRRATRHRRSTR